MPTPSTRRTVPLLALALAAALVAAACGSSGPSCHTVDDCSGTAAVTCTAAACTSGPRRPTSRTRRWSRRRSPRGEESGPGGCCGSRPEDGRGRRTQPAARRSPAGARRFEAALEQETARWAYLEEVPPVEAPAPLSRHDGDPARLDAHLRRLADLRAPGTPSSATSPCWRGCSASGATAGFASFAHYCRERLRLGVRSVEQRIALERRLHDLPALRDALAVGAALLRAGPAGGRGGERGDAAGLDGPGGGAHLRRRCEREVEARREARQRPLRRCVRRRTRRRRPGGVRVPVRVATLLAAAFRAAQRAAQRTEGRWLDPSECLERVARHFLSAWADHPRGRGRRRSAGRSRRDGHRCQVPGCSRAAVHAHHVLFRSHGGGDDEQNLVSLCAAHHLHGVHRGFVRVSGRAPRRLRWTLCEGGVRPFEPAAA